MALWEWHLQIKEKELISGGYDLNEFAVENSTL